MEKQGKQKSGEAEKQKRQKTWKSRESKEIRKAEKQETQKSGKNRKTEQQKSRDAKKTKPYLNNSKINSPPFYNGGSPKKCHDQLPWLGMVGISYSHGDDLRMVYDIGFTTLVTSQVRWNSGFIQPSLPSFLSDPDHQNDQNVNILPNSTITLW